MAKKLKDDFDIDSFMRGERGATGETPSRPPKEGQKGPMRKRNIRLRDADWKALKEHFEAQGIPVSAGIRMVLVQYMKSKGLR